MNKNTKNKWIPKMQTHILAGAEIRAGSRVLYPIIKILVIAAGDRLLGFRLSPIALLISEPGMRYAISMEGKQLALDEVYKLAPSLRDLDLKTADQRIHRICESSWGINASG